MAKVEGSNPFIRFAEPPTSSGAFCVRLELADSPELTDANDAAGRRIPISPGLEGDAVHPGRASPRTSHVSD
jgi:hypothetical protein